MELHGFYEQSDDSTLWGLLVNAGYLTIAERHASSGMCSLRIPNGEVRREFRTIMSRYWGVQDNQMQAMFSSLVDDHDQEAFIRKYKQTILTVTSYHDARENSYHMLLLGMCLYLNGRYRINSNKEAGHGRSDILLEAIRPGDLNIVVELKQGRAPSELAQKALEQIKEKQYFAGLSGPVLLMGIAHDKKECEIQYELRA